MSKNLKAHNFFSMQILFQDRTRMNELLEIVEQVEKMGGNISDITIQVVQSEIENNIIANDTFEDVSNNLYGKYKN